LFIIKKTFIINLVGDWGLGMGIGDWGFGPIPQTPNPNPQTPNPKPPNEILKKKKNL